MRHGKSSYPEGVDDHDRPLGERGRHQAGLAGDWIRSSQPLVDVALCSTAARTRETLESTGIEAPTTFEHSIYGSSPHQLIDLIRGIDDVHETALIVGHAPGIPWTAWELAHNRESLEAAEISQAFPTSAIAVLEFDRAWSDIDPGTGQLLRFHVPR